MKKLIPAVFLTALLALLIWPLHQGLRAQAKQHDVALSWTAGVPNPSLGQTADATYNVYRATVSGGPYTQIAVGLTATAFSDTSGVGGTKYFYVVTGVDTGGFESAFSNEANATFLGLPATPTGNSATSK